jgi:HEAT repeat protein
LHAVTHRPAPITLQIVLLKGNDVAPGSPLRLDCEHSQQTRFPARDGLEIQGAICYPPRQRVHSGFYRFLGKTMAATKLVRDWCILLGLAALSGCHDGVLYKMKSLNPYYQNEWKQDLARGTTFGQRLEELQYLDDQIGSMSVDQQSKYALVLEGVIKNDTSPEMRTQAISVLAKIPGESTIRGLNAASIDKSEKVRLAACQAWSKIGGPDARNMMLTLANNPSESTSVRQAAISVLSKFGDDQVRSTLTGLLDDKSPAIQYQVAQSLKQITNRDYGGDIQAWRDYMAGNDVPQPEQSTLTAFWNSITSLW